jgi:hypothetical protein
VPRFLARSSAALVLSLAAAAAWISPAALGASARPATARPPAVSAISGILNSVAATSASNAWAVGTAGKTSLALHWNGHAWARVAAPGSGLGSVAASSPGNAWAIGQSGTAQLIVHWNGHAWTRTPAPLAKADLAGVSTTSPGNAWVVGEVVSSGSVRTLILHWNGQAWKRVPSPSPHPFSNTGDLLTAVHALSAGNAWAVGATISNAAGPVEGLILHWNGRSWASVPGRAVTKPASGGLDGITATSADNVWAAGCNCAGGPDGGVIGHWNGHGWAAQRTPVQRKLGAVLFSVGASSRSSAFAVGSYCKSGCTGQHAFYTGLILRWAGSAWKISASPGGRNATLVGVAAVSPGSAWAVGDTSSDKVLLLHWNGRSWQSAG